MTTVTTKADGHLRGLLALLLLAVTSLMARPALAQCESLTFEGHSFAVCRATANQDLRLFLNGMDGQVFGSFARIEEMLAGNNQTLLFAMNAGMFHPDRQPVGLYIEDGAEVARIVTREGPGNFGLLPNGVFCIQDDGFAITESTAFAAAPLDCRFATQSGPMLVIDGELHPRFLPDSTSLNIRNGVGVSEDGQTAYFVISDDAVTFHQFARVFRDALGLRQALFLDGSVSRLYAPQLQRSDWGMPMGPVVGLVGPAE